MLILNIGLARKIGENVKSTRVFLELQSAGFIINSFRVVYGSAEPTVVAGVIAPVVGAEALIFAIAETFDQDCIAVYDLRSSKGSLIGPDAASWGEFNREFFLLPDGNPLAFNPAL